MNDIKTGKKNRLQEQILASAMAIITIGSLWKIGNRQQTWANYKIDIYEVKGKPVEAKQIVKVTDVVGSKAKSSHSSNLIRLTDGTELVFWFAGSREGAQDVQIYMATKRNNQWGGVRPVTNPREIMRRELRYIKKVGNPVAAEAPTGKVTLFYVTTALGGWSTSQINSISSMDKGKTWANSKLLTTSPTLNISTLVRGQPVYRENGSFDLPVYHEILNKYPEILHFDRKGNFISKQRMIARDRILQPSITATDTHNAVALMRDASKAKRIAIQTTTDSGKTWSKPSRLMLNNSDSSVATTRLTSGDIILAYNPGETGRRELALATSKNGKIWKKLYAVESHLTGELSYPSIITTKDGIELSYTKDRKYIRVAEINLRELKIKKHNANSPLIEE